MPATDHELDEVAVVARPDSYERLADVFHALLLEQSLDSILERIADALLDLVPHDTLTLYEADEVKRTLTPVFARDQWADEILKQPTHFGKGITGWAVEERQPLLVNEAHLDPRMELIPGTPLEPESFICIPLVARDSVKGALNVYRLGEAARFTAQEFELAKRFGDAAALALDNAQIRVALEHQAQTDSLTGLYNHRYFHERLRSELTRASRSHDSVSLLMLDIDDFKRVNDVYGHATGDQILVTLAESLKAAVRASDVLCRIGGEEFGVIMPSCTAGDALGLAARLNEWLDSSDLDPIGEMTVSIGIAQGPEHAMNPRELVACAEAAMMTAKARGKDRTVLFDEQADERPDAAVRRDVRSIAHLKMLQSLAGKLNRLNDVHQIGSTIANELRSLIDYHTCRVYVEEEGVLFPVAFKGEIDDQVPPHALAAKVGDGITGRAAALGRSILVPNALECEFALTVPGTDEIEESIIATPLSYATRVIGVVVISKLGVGQLDEADVRLLEVLAGQASVALENGRLYEAQRREAENAKALLEFGEASYKAPTLQAICQEAVSIAARLLDAAQASFWLEDEATGEFTCVAHHGYVGDKLGQKMVRARVAPDKAALLLGSTTGPFVADVAVAEDAFGLPPGQIGKTVAIAPLQQEQGLRGWIKVCQSQEERVYFTEERLRLLAGLSYQASLAMQKTRLYKDQKENAEIANALLDFSREVALAEGIEEVVHRIAELSGRILGSPKTSVWLQDPETGYLVPEALWGYHGDELERLARVRLDPDEVSCLLEPREPFVLRPNDLRQWNLDSLFDSARRLTYAVSPLKLEGNRFGCIVAAAPVFGQHRFSERKIRLLAGIADQARLVLAVAGSFESLERTFLSTVEALANALEAKDEYTSTHARSITDLALDVAHELGMDHRHIKRLELGALFHDIGKIGIPSSILLKPGPLTRDEREIMKTHPELGEKILAPIERLEDVRPIVRHCHEHFDGTGYPDGKAADAIPLESRIILVCDAFHAMTTDRPYRNRLPLHEARRRLQAAAGSQFDPNVVDAFLRLLDRDPSFAIAG